MNSRFDNCMDVVLRWEGGYVDHPRDPGGATNYGISLRYARTQGTALDMDADGDVDAQDIRMLTPDKARMVYRQWFWADVRGDELPAGVDLAVFDYAVNSGPSRAIRALQEALGVEVDGVFGPATLRAVKIANAADVVNRVCDQRVKFLRGLSTWDTFGKGWMNRVNDVYEKATNMVGAPQTTAVETLNTNSVRAASTVAAVGAVATAVSQAQPAIAALGALTPWVAVAALAAAVVGVVVWRMGR